MEKRYFKQMEIKQSGETIRILDKTDFKTKVLIRDKEGHYIMVIGAFQKENITLISIYTPNIGTPKYIKQILMDIKQVIDNNRDIAGDFNTQLTSMHRPSRGKMTH